MTSKATLPNRSILFLDDEWIARHTYVWRTIGEPKKIKNLPVMVPDQPWEGTSVWPRTVIYDAGRGVFRLWYQTIKSQVASPEAGYVCYAESKTGLVWEKPHLGQVEYRGTKANNIVLGNLGGLHHGSGGMDSPSILHDPGEADPNRRFKLLVYAWPEGRQGFIVAFSPDGIAWTVRQEPVLGKEHVGDTNSLLLDRDLERPFVSLNRHARMYDDEDRRCIYRSDSDDFEAWTEPELVLAPDLEDPPRSQYYYMNAFKHGDVFVGLLHVCHRDALDMTHDRGDVRLTVSRDTKSWKHVQPRIPFLSPGPTGTFDDTWVTMPPPVSTEADGTHYFFYGAHTGWHSQQLASGSMGLATLPFERFCSISGGHELAGLVELKPFLLPPGQLRLNAVTDFGGSVKVQLILAESNESVASLTMENWYPRTGAFHPVEWENPIPSEWIGREVRLRLRLRAAHLHSLRFVV